MYHSRWARECSFDRSEAAAQVRPFCLELDDMDGSPSFQLDEDLPGSRAEGGTCSADILCLDDQEPFDSAADKEASPQQLSRCDEKAMVPSCRFPQLRGCLPEGCRLCGPHSPCSAQAATETSWCLQGLQHGLA